MASRGRPGRRTLLSAKQNKKTVASEKTIKDACKSKDSEVESPTAASLEQPPSEKSKGKSVAEVTQGDGKDDDIRRSSRRRSGKSALELLGISPRKPRVSKQKAPATVQPETVESEPVSTSQPTVGSTAKGLVTLVSSPKTPLPSPVVKPVKDVEPDMDLPVPPPVKRVTRNVGSVAESTIVDVHSEASPRARRKDVREENPDESPNESLQSEPKSPTRATRSALIVGTPIKDKVNLKVAKGKIAPEEGTKKVPVPTLTKLSSEVPKAPTKAVTKPTLHESPVVIEPLGAIKSVATLPMLAACAATALSAKTTTTPSESATSAKRPAAVSEDEPEPKVQKRVIQEDVPKQAEAKQVEVEVTESPTVEVAAENTQLDPHNEEVPVVEAEEMVVEEQVVSMDHEEYSEVVETESQEITEDPNTRVEEPVCVEPQVEGVEQVIISDDTSSKTHSEPGPSAPGPSAPGPSASPAQQVELERNQTSTPKAAGAAGKTPATKPKTRRKKIVKAVIITPSGEKREIKLDHGVSTVKALEQILAGSTDGSFEDVAKLAADVNRQIEASAASEEVPRGGETVATVPLPRLKKILPAPPKEPEIEKPDLRKLPEEGEIIEAYEEPCEEASGGGEVQEEGNVPATAPVKQKAVVGNYKVVTAVNADDKIAYEALAQLANVDNSDGPITIELSDDSVVDIDWLTQQGLQVVVADTDDQRWHRQMVGVDDGRALAQLVGKKVRARPEKHLVASDDLQELINNLKPDDSMGNHVDIVMHGDVRTIKCRYCGDHINDKHEFRKHMNRHKDVEYKPWKCPICHYRAPVRAQIARHVNIHGELKPFVCKECGKGFNFKQKLLLHLKYHLDIRDRQCPYCELAFHEHKTLKNHLKKIHKVEHFNPEMLNAIRNKKRAAEASSSATQPGAARSQTTGANNGQVDGNIDPVTLKPKKTSLLYGTRKTFLYTQQYKMGLLPAADRNNVAAHTSSEGSQEVTAAVESAAITAAERKRRRVVIPKITSTEQLEPVLQQYCRVKKAGEDGMTARFFCELCEIEPFTSKTGFIHHLEQKHPDIRAWKCPECNYTCRMRSSLIVHMKLHTGIKDYPCEVCGKAFAFKQKLKNHMKHHMNLREFQCHICDKAFNEKNDLTKHVKKVHNSERDCVCTVCSKAFKDQVQLRRHMDGHSDTRYLCEHCNKLYRSRVSLAQHMKSHTCMFHCEICDKNFGSYSGFMAHKVMHDESYEGYECEICRKILHTKGSLTRHLAISHSNERPHACEECGKQFKTKKDLKNHHIVHKADRQFACDVCDFTCKRAESLRVHMRRHSEVKPFQCGVCGKEYTQKHALETHLRHHTGKVEGSCPVCGRDFFTRYQLETHIRRKHQVNLVPVGGEEMLNLETAEKPVTVFMCEECNSVFMSQDSLAVHILAEHMKQGWLNAPAAPAAAAAAASGSATEAHVIAPVANSSQESLLITPGETVEESVIGNTVEVMTEGEGVVVVAPDHQQAVRRSEGGFDGQQTIETLVSISDPGSTKQRLVSLIHPVDSQPGQVVATGRSVGGAGEPQATTTTLVGYAQSQVPKETATQKLNALYEQPATQEAYVAITDPASNQEMLVAMPHSNFESLLAATEAEVQSDGTYTISTTGDDFITVNAAGAGMAGETFVTIASDALETSQALVTLSAGEPSQEHMNNCVAVAETIEIPIETECVTVLENQE